MLTETFTKTVQEARERSRGSVGPGYYALHATGRFVTRRVLEAVVHGVDLDALGRGSIATRDGIAITADISMTFSREEPLQAPIRPRQRHGVDPCRVRRGHHPDRPRLPLIGCHERWPTAADDCARWQPTHPTVACAI